MPTKNNDHKTCHLCRRRVGFPLWYWQRAKKQKPTCENCLVKMDKRRRGWQPPPVDQ